MTKLKNILFSKPLCMGILISAFVYGLVLPFCWGNNPFEPLGTLSILCEDRKIFFWIWVLLVGGGYLLNMNYAFIKYKDNNKFIRVLSVVTFLACFAIALSLKHDITSWNPKRVVHWIATGLYIACVGLSAVIFLLRNVKKYKGFGILTGLTVFLVAAIGLWLAILGKSGMMELIPNAGFQVLLFFLNYTGLFKEKNLTE